jgi:O-antigen ligase
VGTAALLVVGAVLVTTSVQGDSAQRFTSGRSQLVSGTARVFADHPLVGVGIGAQPKATREAGGKKLTRRNASHTTPLTIAAEGGIIGLALYVAFLLGAAKLLDGVHRMRPVLGLGLAGAFLVLFVHSLLYAGFFQDPLVWGVVGLAAAVLATLPQGEAARGSSARARVAATPVPGRWQT